MKKIAISLPDEQAEAVEKLRKQGKIPRSRVIQKAIAYYLADQSLLTAVREYEEGYRRTPEDPSEAEAYATATAAVLGKEDWG